jgi:heat shock protein HslJ
MSDQRLCGRNAVTLQLAKKFLNCLRKLSIIAVISRSSFALDNLVWFGVSPAIIEGQVAKPIQSGKNISELDDTFWDLKQIQGSNINLSGVIIKIHFLNPHDVGGLITFSTPSYSAAFPFLDKSTGLEFFPADAHRGVSESFRFSQDQQASQLFESALHRACCYKLHDHILTLVDKDQIPIVLLSPVRQTGIENQRWRITRYRGDEDNSTQKDGLIDAKETADIIFMNGQVYGSSGCGGWVGKYAVSGDNLTSDIGTILAGLCSPEQLAQSFWVEKALKGDRRIKRERNNILLRDWNGKTQLLLVPF